MDDAELIEQTLIFDALEWPQQAQPTMLFSQVNDPNSWDVSEQAHMMSAPTRQHVSDAAAEAIAKGGGANYEAWAGLWAGFYGVRVITVAEHEEFVTQLEIAEEQLKRTLLERDEANAERHALRAEVAAQRDHILMMADHIDAMIEQDRIAWDQIERLRKGRDDGPICDGSHVVGETHSRCPQHPKSSALAMVADTLDHRLGTQLPDGEPVAPMSQRKPYRWGMV